MTTSQTLAVFFLLGAGSACGAGSNHANPYLVERDGRKMLKEPLTVREEQAGIIGTTGTMWTIEPSGEWRVVRFHPDKDGTEQLTPRGHGKLGVEQLATLAQTLAAHDLAALPARTGRESPVNSHRYTIKFGSKTATLAGVGPRRRQTAAENIRKAAPAHAAPESSVWTRFADLIQAVETHCPTAEGP